MVVVVGVGFGDHVGWWWWLLTLVVCWVGGMGFFKVRRIEHLARMLVVERTSVSLLDVLSTFNPKKGGKRREHTIKRTEKEKEKRKRQKEKRKERPERKNKESTKTDWIRAETNEIQIRTIIRTI